MIEDYFKAHGLSVLDVAKRLNCSVRTLRAIERTGLQDGVSVLGGRPCLVTVQTVAQALGVDDAAIRTGPLAPLVNLRRQSLPPGADAVAAQIEKLRAVRPKPPQRHDRAPRAPIAVRLARGERLAAWAAERGITGFDVSRMLGDAPRTFSRLKRYGFRRDDEGGRGVTAEQIEAALGMAPGTLTAGE